MIPRHVPLVETTRGGTTECVHYGSIAVVDAHGKLVASAGDPDSLNFTRSALKPLQALPFVEDRGLAHFGFGSHRVGIGVQVFQVEAGDDYHRAVDDALVGDM